MSARIHPTAVVHPSAELGEGVGVGPYCVVGAGVRIGDESILQNHVTVQGPTTIGRDNVFYPYAVIGAEPQDLKYEGHDTELIIGDRNKVREHATIHRGTELGGGRTQIGSDCLVMVGVHIAHDCIIEDEVVIANNSMVGGHCLIESGATVAGGVGVHHFTTVGTLAFVGGMSRIAKDVPPYLVVEGSPGEVRKVNTTALMRRRWPAEQVERVKQAYRLIYRSDMSAVEAIASLRRDEAGCGAVQRLCDFIERVELGTYGRQREAERAKG